MQIHKKRIKKEDGRYLIYYTFTDETKEEEKEGRDVRAEMESHPELKKVDCLQKYQWKIMI